MKNYFILCGANRTPYHFWYPWLFQKLKEETDNVYCPALPKMEFINYKNWSKIIKAYLKIGAINKDTIFVCHSTACVFLARFICKNKLNIKGIIFVAGFNTLNINNENEELKKEVIEVNKSFFAQEKQINKLDKFCKNIYAFISDNDPMIETKDLKEFADITKAKPITIKDGGHFNDEKFKTFTKLLERINSIK